MDARKLIVVLVGVAVLLVIGAVLFLKRPAGSAHSAPEPSGTVASTARREASSRPVVDDRKQLAPTPTAGPSGNVELVLVFRRTSTPADSVRIAYSSGAETLFAITNELGRASIPAASTRLEFADELTSLTLGNLERAPADSTTIDIPEPVRFRIDLREEGRPAPPDSRVRLGWGEAEAASQRVRRNTGLAVKRGPQEDAPFGLQLPPSPSHWDQATLDSDGRFVTRWITAEHAPQLVAWTPQGRLAMQSLTFADDLAPRSTIDEDLALDPLTALEVTVEHSPDFDPIPIALGIREGILDKAHSEKAALLLSVADQIDAPMGDFFAMRGNVFVDGEGTRLIAPVPAFESLYFVARGAIPALVPERTVAVPYGQTTRVVFSAAELYPTITRTRRFAGRCVIEGSDDAAPGVVIVASWLGQKREQVTSDQGRFVFNDLPENLEITFQIDAYDTGSPPRFSRSLTKSYDGLADLADPIDEVWEIPAFKWLLVEDASGLLARAEGSREVIVALERRNEAGEWEAFGDVLDFYFPEQGAEIEVRREGWWRAKVLSDGFVTRYSDAGDLTGSKHEARVKLQQPVGVKPMYELRFRRPNGQPAPGVTVYLTPGFPDAATLETKTDASGIVRFGPYNIDRVGLRVGDEAEGFEGDVPLTGVSALIELKPLEEE